MKKLGMIALALATPLAGCASSNLIVEQPNRSTLRASSAALAYDGGTVGVPEATAAYVQRKMEAALFGGDAPVFARGQEITIRYRFLSFDEGSRLGRYMLGGLAGGQANMLLEAEFVSPTGETLARIRGNGEVAGGFFGGSSNSAIDEAIDEIAAYAAANFRR